MSCKGANIAAEQLPPAKKAKLGSPSLPVLDRDAYLSKLRAVTEPMMNIGAMYNSLVGGIVTDRELMAMPIHDHAIVRGHAVFDTCSVSNGRLYRVDIHLDRHLLSAEKSRIPLPFGPSAAENKERMRSIIAQTVVATGWRDCGVRYWLTAGPGDLQVTPEGCTPAWYVIVYSKGGAVNVGDLVGIRDYTVNVPMKPPCLATVKSNNYMLNVLHKMEARDKGGQWGVLVDKNGYVAESCVLNVAFVTQDRRFITPPFDLILAGTTVRKCLELSTQLVSEGLLAEVSQEPVPEGKARECVEMMFLGGDSYLVPVTHWDNTPMGLGVVGEVTKRLSALLKEDMAAGSSDHYELAYPDAN